MREYKSVSEFDIIGRGKVFCVICDVESCSDLFLKTVLIDGKKYIVKGVERNTVSEFSNDLGKTIGLCVRKLLK